MFNKKPKEEEKKGVKEIVKENENNNKELQEKLKKIEELENEIKKHQIEEEKWKNKFFESFADIDNLRKSIEKERSDIYKYRLNSFVEEIIDILDGFDLAFKYKVDDEKTKNFLIGFQSLHKKMLDILSKEGVQEINPKKGDNFDESTMKAIETIFQEGENNENKIIETKFKGYKLSDRLVRPAVVVVATNKKNNK